MDLVEMLPRILPCLLLMMAASACATPAAGGPPDPRTMIPEGVSPEWLHFSEAAAEQGEPAPDFTLSSPDGQQSVTLSGLVGQPVVLVFGSFT